MLNSPLKFHWTAVLKDGTEIAQFDANGVEHLYKEVLDRADKLVTFYLVHITKPLKLTIDVTRGILFINGKQDTSWENVQEIKHNVRVIFFRRHKETTNLDFKLITHEIFYFLGYQYNGVNGVNYQTVVQLNDNGDMVIQNG